MPSQVLALKYRPKRFDDIVGNRRTVEILRNSIIQEKLRNAYFFAGGKGSGKTSTARIFAKAVNCSKRQEQDPEPCCSCISCLEADRDVVAGDIEEVDAASQNSVQAIRSLVARLQYPPQSSKFRIIILDEVHMLSNAASNALLKTLEEPPEHVIFLFCTTDPQKVLETVRSRALYFEFQRLTSEEIASRLIHVAGAENIYLDQEAALILGMSVNGALRDAITILDQASILTDTVNVEVVDSIIGRVPVAKLYELFTHVHSGDNLKIQEWFDSMYDKLEQDIIVGVLDFIEILILLNMGADVSQRIPSDISQEVKKLSQVFSMQQLFAMGYMVKQSLNDYRRLALRNSRVLIRLMLVGLILCKEGKQDLAKSFATPLLDLVKTGDTVEFDVSGILKKLFNAQQVELEE